ncbi:ribosome silencing factor [Pleurocapsales cyanobacterium LEGE 06147]|nr:ribosome silencing factor [Pleurocapsales cyanobacterium LEGE 06147]
MRQQQKYAIDNLSNQNQTAIDAIPTSQELAWKIAEAADDKKAADIAILQVEDVSYLTDYFVIATGFSKIQVKAIADAIEEKIAEQFQINPVRVEGKTEGNWVVQDYGEVIVHIFLPSEREYYTLEAFWGHAKRIEFSVSK